MDGSSDSEWADGDFARGNSLVRQHDPVIGAPTNRPIQQPDYSVSASRYPARGARSVGSTRWAPRRRLIDVWAETCDKLREIQESSSPEPVPAPSVEASPSVRLRSVKVGHSALSG